MKNASQNSSEEKDSFLTIAAPVSGLYKDRGSKFFYFAYPIHQEEDIRNTLAELKKTHYDASHHCYAWVMGPEGENFRANDDGEPNHTAGDPILGQIRSFRLTEVLIVVVRYFGGTKLGVSGLIQAYKTSAYEALSQATIYRKWIMRTIQIQFGYAEMNDVMKLVKAWELTVLGQELTMDCRLTLEVKQGIFDQVLSQLQDIEGLILLND